MLELYHTNGSVCSQKVRLALAEKGLDWEDRHIQLSKDEHLRPEYLALNPNGVVPTLVHDGRVVIESAVINEYIEGIFPDPPLAPSDHYERARMRTWTKQLDESIHAAVGTISACTYIRVRHLERTPEEVEARLAKVPVRARRERVRQGIEMGADAPAFEESVLRFAKLFADMETALADSPWLVGDQFSLADLDFIPYVTRIERLRFGGMYMHLPKVRDWFDRACARPSYQEAIKSWETERATQFVAETGGQAWPKVEAILNSVNAD